MCAPTLDAVSAQMSVDLNLPEDRVGPRARRKSKRVWVGGTAIGDGAPVSVQSMCTTLTHDVDATIRQIERLQEVGCEIARVAVPDKRGGEALKEIVRRSILPIVADIHFDYRLALMALDAKVHKLRLNPGNLHNKDGVREVVKRAKEQGTPIRIGVNHGSIGDRQPGDIRDESQRMVDLALSEIRILEDLDFDDIVVSVKAFEVPVMIVACPSCGRADIDLIPLAKVAEERLRALPVPMKVAVMGCEVNGPGEAKDADVGIAGGVGKGAIFRKGKVVGTYPESELMDALLREIDKILIEHGKEPYAEKAPKLSHEGQLTPGRSVPAGTRT